MAATIALIAVFFMAAVAEVHAAGIVILTACTTAHTSPEAIMLGDGSLMMLWMRATQDLEIGPWQIKNMKRVRASAAPPQPAAAKPIYGCNAGTPSTDSSLDVQIRV